MSAMPSTLRAITAFMTLGALLLLSLSALLTAFGAMGTAGTLPDEAAMTRLYSLTIPPLLLFFLSIAALAGIYRRLRFGWHSSVLLWVLSIAYVIYFQYALPTLLPIQLFIIASIIVINVFFIAYFNTRTVKAYFSIK